MTAITRYEPFRAVRREFDRLFEDLLPALAEEGPAPAWMPRFDLTETDDSFVARLDLPGLKPEDVTVEMEENRLIVRGERKQEFTEKKENAVRMERTFGTFFRSFTLPRNVNPDGIDAWFSGGVLTLTIPKAEESRPRKIEVHEGKELHMN